MVQVFPVLLGPYIAMDLVHFLGRSVQHLKETSECAGLLHTQFNWLLKDLEVFNCEF